MRVLHVAASLSARWGGPTHVVRELAENMVRKGVEVSVFSPSGTNTGNGISNLKGVDLKVFKEGVFSKAWTGYSPGISYALAREVPKFDIIHMHEIWHYPHYAAYQSIKKFDKSFIITTHGSLDPWCLELKSFRKRIYAGLIQRRILNDAAAIHALTKKEAKDIQAFGVVAPITIIPNGIDLSKFQALPQSSEIEMLYPELSGKKVLLFLGRIHPKKGLANLANAFGQVARSRNDVHLLIVGPDNDNYRSQVEYFLKSEGVMKKTTFTGMLADRDKLAALRRADICVIPSYSEGMSIVILEAMASGLPVVVTRQCNFPEVAEANAGITIETNADQLAKALNKLIDDPKLCKEMGENGRQLVMENFAWDKIADKMIQLYENVLER